ncbi:uncharacterized protein G2W53_035072 [Senna tora]|uniref:Uncharacterized protein n=1 Tax=Senna tora TaxID=362788 RepID=A0A834SQS6_9FABA|nr:uncharacterized protein G2W53_035072 [Senna tora]
MKSRLNCKESLKIDAKAAQKLKPTRSNDSKNFKSKILQDREESRGGVEEGLSSLSLFFPETMLAGKIADEEVRFGALDRLEELPMFDRLALPVTRGEAATKLLEREESSRCDSSPSNLEDFKEAY